jgi:hypothetical protein
MEHLRARTVEVGREPVCVFVWRGRGVEGGGKRGRGVEGGVGGSGGWQGGGA